MPRRRNEGNETIHRLEDWDRGQAASERLAAHLLQAEGFRSVDPAHPLGGPDGLKDVLCERDGQTWVGAAYFPRGAQSFRTIQRKFQGDVKGAGKESFAFVTNQRLTKGQRSKLICADRDVTIIHLERMAHLLDTPALYGIRLEFLDIEMSSAEQVSFFASRDDLFRRLFLWLERLESSHLASEASTMLHAEIPLDELREFRAILGSISTPWLWSGEAVVLNGPRVQDLRVPLEELREFADTLNAVCGWHSASSSSALVTGATVRDLKVPLDELRDFAALLGNLHDRSLDSAAPRVARTPMTSLHVPLDELREYDKLLDTILAKIARLPRRTNAG